MTYGQAQKEAVRAAKLMHEFQKVSAERRRAHVFVEQDDGTRTDVTESVVSLLDMITQSMDWGSEFWVDNDLDEFIALCKMLKFEGMPDE
jgi:hypothetical protein